MNFFYRLFKQGSHTLLAIADAEILGKSFSEDELQLHVSERFYGGEKCSRHGVEKLAGSATIINAVGKNIISLLAEKNIIGRENVVEIGGVPHAQVIVIR